MKYDGLQITVLPGLHDSGYRFLEVRTDADGVRGSVVSGAADAIILHCNGMAVMMDVLPDSTIRLGARNATLSNRFPGIPHCGLVEMTAVPELRSAHR